MAIREIIIKESRGKFSIFKGNSKDKDYDFSGISALRQVLGNEKARILSVIKLQKPDSIYALSKQLGRNFKGVYQDTKLLERFGFIELIPNKIKNRERYKPVITSDIITIHIKF